MTYDLNVLLSECERLHGHICAGQVLGVRMALLGCRLSDVPDPRGVDRKKLIVWVEIDRCMTDAVSAVTGVRLGKRSLKYFDYGKVAATFFNIETQEAWRIVALEEARELADTLYPFIAGKKERQLRAYREASDSELFKTERVIVSYSKADEPGRPRSRVICAQCNEGINDGRELLAMNGNILCRPCASEGYYQVREFSAGRCGST